MAGSKDKHTVVDPHDHPPELSPNLYPRTQHSVSRSKIDPDAISIMYRLNRHGYKAYLVGGGVRDLLLGKKPKDFDIATDATPRQVKALFRNSRVIGRRFKLVHVFFPHGKNIEVSTFRDSKELPDEEELSVQIERDNHFGTASTDALRRDITINALFYDIATFSIIDYVGGMMDLKEKIIRVIGEPEVRFIEDPVRLLRVVRHAARTNFTIEAKCLAALSKNRSLLEKASQVRVYEEVKKDLVSGYCLPCLRLMHKTGLLPIVIPLLEKEGVLFEGSHLPICLERIDDSIRYGLEVSPTLVLTLISLYCPKRGASYQGLQHFESNEEFEDHVKRVFEKLMVPRKERERMTELSEAFHRVLSYDARDAKAVRGPINHEVIEEVRQLYEIIFSEELDNDVLHGLTHGGARKKTKSSNQKRRRGRRHHDKAFS